MLETASLNQAEYCRNAKQIKLINEAVASGATRFKAYTSHLIKDIRGW